MPLVLSVAFVSLKIVVGDTLIFFWLWLARDRSGKRHAPFVDFAAAVLFWLVPWLAFLWRGSSLYGDCGVSQGPHTCGLAEFLWSELGWVRFGFLLDAMLFAVVLLGVTRLRTKLDTVLGLGHPTKGPSETG